MVKLLLWKKTDIIGTLLHILDLCLHILHWYTVLIFGTYLACSSSTQTSGGCSGKTRETLSTVFFSFACSGQHVGKRWLEISWTVDQQG